MVVLDSGDRYGTWSSFKCRPLRNRICVKKLLHLTTHKNKLRPIKRCNYKSLIWANLKKQIR